MARRVQPRGESPRTARQIVEDVFTPRRTKTLWTANCLLALPITPQDFDVSAVLPAMLYMARFGHRRGKGKFAETFGERIEQATKAPTVASVAASLIARPESCLDGFSDEIGGLALADLLLAWVLENRKHSEGHWEQIQRIYPSHYLASWIDLPDQVMHLRGVPELLTVLLAHQPDGETLAVDAHSRFPVGVKSHKDNLLLDLLGRHMEVRGAHPTDFASDVFVENRATDIGIDELLAIRLAQACRSAPLGATGANPRIPNRQPIASRAADVLREDMSVFIDVYGRVVPRQGFLQMLEAGIALGLTNLILSTALILDDWQRTGSLAETADQAAWPLFVDASQGQDKTLRDQSEASMTECLRRYERMPIAMMLLRILEDSVSSDQDLKNDLPSDLPDPHKRITFLGHLYHNRHPDARLLFRDLQRDCQRLADALEGEDEFSDVANALQDTSRNAGLRLAEALCELMGDRQQRAKFLVALDSALMTDKPGGLAVKRRVTRTNSGERRNIDLRSVVLSSTLLDFLVHRHLRKAAHGSPFHALSLPQFIGLLRKRYGLYIDQEPPGQRMPQELLRRNKDWFERRLRDLGLLIGVNDAESMKQLRPRYKVESDDAV